MHPGLSDYTVLCSCPLFSAEAPWSTEVLKPGCLLKSTGSFENMCMPLSNLHRFSLHWSIFLKPCKSYYLENYLFFVFSTDGGVGRVYYQFIFILLKSPFFSFTAFVFIFPKLSFLWFCFLLVGLVLVFVLLRFTFQYFIIEVYVTY